MSCYNKSKNPIYVPNQSMLTYVLANKKGHSCSSYPCSSNQDFSPFL